MIIFVKQYDISIRQSMKTTKYLLALILSLLFSFDSAFSQWTDLNPWNTAKITGIEIVDSTYFVATENGIWRSQDSMQTWQRINQGLPNLRISKLFANDKVTIATIDSVGVFLSKDRGNTWTKSDFKHSNLQFTDIDSDSNLIYIATYQALYSSSDNGETWSDTLLTAPYIKVKCIGSDLYCGTLGKGIYYSSNKGKDWERRNTGIQNYLINSIDGNSEFLLATTEQNLLANIYFSKNKGKTWENLNNDTLKGSKVLWPLTTAIVNDGALYLRDITGTIYISTNLGKEWQNRHSSGNMHGFEYKKHKGNLFWNYNGNNLIYQIKKNMFDTLGYSLIAPYNSIFTSLYSTDSTLLLGTYNGIFFSNDYGTNIYQSYYSNSYRSIFKAYDKTVFALNIRGNELPSFLVSNNYVIMWDTSNFSLNVEENCNINKYKDTLYLISRFGYVYSTNNGKDWTTNIKYKMNAFFLLADMDIWYFKQINDGKVIFSKSFDKGITFVDLKDVTSLGIGELFQNRNSLIFNSRLNVVLLTKTTNQLLDVTKNLPTINDTVVIHKIFVKDEIIFCQLMYTKNNYSKKLFFLNDINSQWQEFSNNENIVYGDYIYADDKYLYSFSPRLYRTELSNFKSTSIEIDNQSENQVVISLAQDILSFNLTNDEISSIEIYNSLGKTIYSQSGIESIDVSNLANGVYFVKIQPNGKIIVNKFVKY